MLTYEHTHSQLEHYSGMRFDSYIHRESQEKPSYLGDVCATIATGRDLLHTSWPEVMERPPVGSQRSWKAPPWLIANSHGTLVIFHLSLNLLIWLCLFHYLKFFSNIFKYLHFTESCIKLIIIVSTHLLIINNISDSAKNNVHFFKINAYLHSIILFQEFNAVFFIIIGS